MTYAENQKSLATYVSYKPPKRNATAKKVSILQRIFGAMFVSRRMQAERKIVNVGGRQGGRRTDDLEREMVRRMKDGNQPVTTFIQLRNMWIKINFVAYDKGAGS